MKTFRGVLFGMFYRCGYSVLPSDEKEIDKAISELAGIVASLRMSNRTLSDYSDRGSTAQYDYGYDVGYNDAVDEIKNLIRGGVE